MLRLRIVVPLLCSSLTIPSVGESAASICQANSSMSPRCEAVRARVFAAARNAEIDASIAAVKAERERAFAAARNAEIEASIAAVKAERARLALSRTHCKTPDSTTPRCEAERARDFAQARNAEIDASIAAVKAERMFATARNAEIDASIAKVNAVRAPAFAAARNAEINASIAAVKAERERAFAAERNAEIRASIAAVAAARIRRLASSTTHCNGPEQMTPRCEAERAREFAQVRNAEINASIAAVRAERERAFAAARNAEIRAALAAYEAQRALRLAQAGAAGTQASSTSTLETSAINPPDAPAQARSQPSMHHTLHAEPCRDAGRPMNALRFSGVSAVIDDAMKPELDRIAAIAKTCPAVRIEIHGHSDDWGPAQVNRRLAEGRAQAAVAYLVNAGVERNRLAAIGHGASEPIAPNTTNESRAKNRRIEVTLRDPALEAAALRVMWDLAELLDPTYVPPLARLSP